MLKGRHFYKSVILLSVRWYLAYNLSLRNLKEMMAERGIDLEQRTRSMLGFKSETAASITLAGIELIHMMRKQQGIFSTPKALSIKQQFEAFAA